MKIKDSKTQGGRSGRVLVAGLLATGVFLSGDTAPGPSSLGTDEVQAESVITHSPLIPKKTRHIIGFSRWGVA